ncbi:hypothetical protein D3C80_1731580 [compost metagenome]
MNIGRLIDLGQQNRVWAATQNSFKISATEWAVEGVDTNDRFATAKWRLVKKTLQGFACLLLCINRH